MILEQLKQWIDLNYKIFPVIPNEKKPLIKDWNNKASSDPEVIATWIKEFPNCNWGMACGPSGKIVLDVDPKNGGNDSLYDLDFEIGIPDTFEVRTPSGGRHLYMTGECRNRTGMLPGIDIRGCGGYVVIPPSVVGGKPYTVAGGTLVAAPENMVAKIGAKHEATPKDPGVCNDNPVDVARSIAFLGTHPGAIEDNAGDFHTLVTAMQLHDMGVTRETAYSVMLEHWNDKCSPPWSAEDLWTKVYNGYQYAKKKAGNASIENHPFKPVYGPDELIPYHELWDTNQPREWIAEGWIPEGPACPTLLAGDGGTGKSLAALQLCMAVASGTDWLGIKTTQRTAIYVGCEDDEIELGRRLNAIQNSDPVFKGRKDFSCFLLSRTGRDAILFSEQDNKLVTGKFHTILDRILGGMGKEKKLLVLDTVADIFCGNENNRPLVNAFIKTGIGELAKRHNCTVMLLAHPAKSQGSEFSGSTAWNNSVRNRLFLCAKDKKNPTYKVLKNAKANYSPVGAELLLKWNNGILSLVSVEETEVVWDSAVYEKIAAAAEAKNPLTYTYHGGRFVGDADIHLTGGGKLDKKDIVKCVDRLIEAGRVKNNMHMKHKNGLFPVGTIPESSTDEDSGEDE